MKRIASFFLFAAVCAAQLAAQTRYRFRADYHDFEYTPSLVLTVDGQKVVGVYKSDLEEGEYRPLTGTLEDGYLELRTPAVKDYVFGGSFNGKEYQCYWSEGEFNFTFIATSKATIPQDLSRLSADALWNLLYAWAAPWIEADSECVSKILRGLYAQREKLSTQDLLRVSGFCEQYSIDETLGRSCARLAVRRNREEAKTIREDLEGHSYNYIDALLDGTEPLNVDDEPEAPANPTAPLADRELSFHGGDLAFLRYVEQNLRHPAGSAAMGRVMASVTVEADGAVSDVKILRGLDADSNAEAIRLLKASPRWDFKVQGGRPVRDSKVVTITFH